MTTRRTNPVPRCVDVLVVCALDVELKALRKAFGASVITNPEDGRVGRAVEEFYAAVDGLDVLCVKIPFPGAGNVTSATVTASLLPLVEPWLIVSFGLAGTFDEKAVPKRRAVFSRSVSYIDLRKETGRGVRIGKNIATHTTASDLMTILGDLQGATGLPVDIVSSEAVVKSDNAQVRAAASRAVSDAKVVEMEAFGVFQAWDLDRLLNVTKRYCVAIKAISDHADITKDDEEHSPAAEEATKLLLALLRDARTLDLREKSSLYAQPLPFRPLTVTDRADERTAAFLATAQPVLEASVDRELLQGVHLRTGKPRIFYHWRLTANGLHWVELHFLRVFRQLGRAGYPIECLVTDEIREDLRHNKLHNEPDLRRARATVDQMVRALFRDVDCRITYFSEVKQRDRYLEDFGASSGCGYGFYERLSTAPGSSPTLNTEFNLWFRHIAWRSQVEGTCLVFHHPDRSMIYSLLWHFADLVPGLISTPVMNLGDMPGKTDPPGRDLFLAPPRHADIRRWLARANESADVLRQLWEYITESPRPDEEFILERRRWAVQAKPSIEILDPEPQWLHAFHHDMRDTPDFYKGAIAIELAHWTEILSGADALASA